MSASEQRARARARYAAKAALRPTRKRRCEICAATMVQLRRRGRPPLTCGRESCVRELQRRWRTRSALEARAYAEDGQ